MGAGTCVQQGPDHQRIAGHGRNVQRSPSSVIAQVDIVATDHTARGTFRRERGVCGNRNLVACLAVDKARTAKCPFTVWRSSLEADSRLRQTCPDTPIYAGMRPTQRSVFRFPGSVQV